jgi:hypothetical protein
VGGEGSMSGKGNFSTSELFLAEEYGKGLVRFYGDCRLPNHYEAGMKRWLELLPWVPERFEEVNNKPFPSIKMLKRGFIDNKSRRAARQTIAKQMAADTEVKLFLARQQPLTMEEVYEKSLTLPIKPHVLEFLYGLEFFEKGTLVHAGVKIGRTAKAPFRAGHIKYEIDKYDFANEYALLLPLGVMSKERAEKIQDEAIHNCILQGCIPIYKKEYLNATVDQAKSAMIKAVVTNGIDPTLGVKRWDMHNLDNVFKLRGDK